MAIENATLNWGKCKIKIDDALVLDDIQEGSTNLNTEQGDKTEAIVEGGEVIATRYQRNKYTLEFVEFGKASVDNIDGIVAGNHKIELISCDEGVDKKVLTIPSSVINVQSGFTSEYGTVTTYTCTANRQENGSIVWADQTANPTITITDGSLTITHSDSDADLFYTIDGTTPATSATGSTKKWASAVALTASCVVRAIAVVDGSASSVVSQSYIKA